MTEIGRRTFLSGLGASAGLLLTGGVPRWLGGHPHADLGYAECLDRIDRSLTLTQRALTVRPWDHPSRQLTNTVSIFKAPHIGSLFGADQVALIHRLYETLLSAQGRDWLTNTITLEGKLEGCLLAIYSDAPAGELARDRTGRTQTMLSGAHLMLREGGREASGSPFGGGIAYGQQLGNHVFRVQGNAFSVHGDAANVYYAALDPSTRAASLAPTPPNELMVQVQGEEGIFTGAPLGSASGAAREAGTELVHTVLAAYPAAQRADALSSIEANGGLDRLHATFYEDRGFYEDGGRYDQLDGGERSARELPYWQVWRIEGPGTVMHFKGYPHVHAYVNVVRDLSRQNVGEVLTRAPRTFDSAQVQGLLLAALREETGEALAYYRDKPPARICLGDVTTGLAYALDPFADDIVVATIRVAAMSAELRAVLRAQGAAANEADELRVATLRYFAGSQERFGEPERVESWHRPMRDALVAYLRDRDLGGSVRG